MSLRTFDDDFSWSCRVQERHAIPIYEQYWTGCNILEVDAVGRDETVARHLDFGDVDKIIELSNGTSLHVAQRFRQPRQNGQQVDFSFRCHRPHADHPVEYERLLEAYQTEGASYPARYAFGVTHPDAVERGFQQFWIFKTEPILEAIESGEIEPTSPIPNPDGTKARYIEIDDLHDAGCVAHEFTTTQLSWIAGNWGSDDD